MEALAVGQFVEKQEPVLVVRLAVEQMDGESLEEVKRFLESAVEDGRRLVLDLSNTENVDSAGLNFLLQLWQQIQTGGGDIKLCALKSRVQMLLQLVRMHRIFAIYDTSEEAVNAFEQSERRDLAMAN